MLNDSPSRSNKSSLAPSSRLAATAFYMAVLSIGLFVISRFNLVMWAGGCALALVALVLGGVSHARLGGTDDSVGKTQSKAAIIIGALFLGLSVVVILLFLNGLSQSSPSSWH
jgi:hypothetical protein